MGLKYVMVLSELGLSQPTSPHPAPNPALQSEGYNYLFHPRQFRRSTRSAGMRFRSGVPRHSSILDAEEALYTADAEAKHKELLEVDNRAHEHAAEARKQQIETLLQKERELLEAESQIKQNDLQALEDQVDHQLMVAEAQRRHAEETAQIEAELAHAARNLQNQEAEVCFLTDQMTDWQRKQFYAIPFRGQAPYPSMYNYGNDNRESVLFTNAHIN